MCRDWLPKTTSPSPVYPILTSLSTRTWQARKAIRALKDNSVASIFLGWQHLARFRRLHKQIRQYSRQNNKKKFEDFLQEGADLALHHQTYDWFRRTETSEYPNV